MKEYAEENGSIYDTDPDSRMMKVNNNNFDICHNVQIAVDDKTHMIVAADVTSKPIDKEQFHHMSKLAKDELKVDRLICIADKGYYSAKEFGKCEKDNIIPMVSKADYRFNALTNQYSKDKFKYDHKKDVFICPEGQTLIPYNKRKNNPKYEGHKGYYNQMACEKCPKLSMCSKSPKGRVIKVKPDELSAMEVDKRMRANKDMYKKISIQIVSTICPCLNSVQNLTR